MSLPEGARVTEREGGGDTPAGRVAPVESGLVESGSEGSRRSGLKECFWFLLMNGCRGKRGSWGDG